MSVIDSKYSKNILPGNRSFCVLYRATEQLTLWVIIALVLVALTYTSICLTPFSHQPLPYPAFLIRLILGAGVARFSVAAARIVLVRDVVADQIKTAAMPGQSGFIKLDFLYNAISATANFICLGYHQNLLLGLTSSFMEVSSTPLECCRLIEQAKRSTGSRSYRKTAILSCAVCFLVRPALPLLLLIIAANKESPLVMDNIPLVSFFICIIFYSSYNTLLLSQSVRRALQSSRQCRAQESHLPSSCPTPFSIPVLPNVILENTSTDENEGKRRKNFNQDLLKSLDNRNLCCSFSSGAIDKMNVTETRERSKIPALHKKKENLENEKKKFSLSRYMDKMLERSSSKTLLLDSQDLFVDNETDTKQPLSDSDSGKVQYSNKYCLNALPSVHISQEGKITDKERAQEREKPDKCTEISTSVNDCHSGSHNASKLGILDAEESTESTLTCVSSHNPARNTSARCNNLIAACTNDEITLKHPTVYTNFSLTTSEEHDHKNSYRKDYNLPDSTNKHNVQCRNLNVATTQSHIAQNQNSSNVSEN